MLLGPLPFGIKMVLSTIPQANTYQMAFWIMSFEGVGQGLTSQTMWQQYGNYSAGEGMILYVVGGVIFMLLGLYLDQVIPSEYGSNKHPCFMFMPSTYR